MSHTKLNLCLKLVLLLIMLLLLISSASAFSRTRARNYAERWSSNSANLRNPNYFSFSSDCTNFVSQALGWQGGGYCMQFSYPAWYMCNCCGNWSYSYSWIRVTSLCCTLRSRGWGQWKGTRSKTAHCDGASCGDIILYDWDSDGSWNHMSMLVCRGGWDPVKRVYGDLINQHTTDRYHAIWHLQPYRWFWQRHTVALMHVTYGSNVAIAAATASPLRNNALADNLLAGEQPSNSVAKDNIDRPKPEFPQGPDVKHLNYAIEAGLKIGLEAGLKRNKGKENQYKDNLKQYYSETRKGREKKELYPNNKIDEDLQSFAQSENKKELNIQTLPNLDANASEWERQCWYIDNGRKNEIDNNFEVRDFGIDSIEYTEINIKGDIARVVADVKGWAEFVFTNPDGTKVVARPEGADRHTFLLERKGKKWRITEDTFTILPGYEP